MCVTVCEIKRHHPHFSFSNDGFVKKGHILYPGKVHPARPRGGAKV
jgi:hypothetical protein